MKSLNTNKTMLLTLLLTIAFTVSAYAGSGSGKCPFSDKDAGDRPAKCKGLTEDQRGQLVELRQQFIDDTADLRISLNTAHKNLAILMETSEPDKKAIKDTIKEIMELKTKLMEKQIDHQLAINKIIPATADCNMFGACKQGMRRSMGFQCMRDDNGPRPLFFPGCRGCGL